MSASNVGSADSASIVMWAKTELKLDQVGKMTILANTPLVKLNTYGSLTNVGTLKPGEEFRVYSYKSNHRGLHGMGGGSLVKKDNKAKYEKQSKSKSKLALLKKISENLEPTPQVNDLLKKLRYRY